MSYNHFTMLRTMVNHGVPIANIVIVLLLLLLVLVSLLQVDATLPDEGAADLLQLALNCSSATAAATAVGHMPATAVSAASLMPALLEPVVAGRLLVTAATRQHAAAVTCMASTTRVEYMQQHIDAATLEAMLVRLLGQDSCLRLLSRLPAATHLSVDAVMRLLKAATNHGDIPPALLHLPAARSSTEPQIVAGIVAVLQHLAAEDQQHLAALQRSEQRRKELLATMTSGASSGSA
jgi:hypothetical protein